MFIFRVEHKREYCEFDSRYQIGGSSLTGHGTFRKCYCYDDRESVPNFGLWGSPPLTVMMEHERCAVTAVQWDSWIAPDYSCHNDCSDHCKCPARFILNMTDKWHIVCYWVEDDARGTDWRIDNNQVVFNPAFAINLGSVEEWEVIELESSKISA